MLHGDPSAFEEIVRRTSRLVFARLYLETGDNHRAEDLLQETWLRAFRAFGELKDARNLRSWLLTIASHALTDATRGDLARKRGGASSLPRKTWPSIPTPPCLPRRKRPALSSGDVSWPPFARCPKSIGCR